MSINDEVAKVLNDYRAEESQPEVRIPAAPITPTTRADEYIPDRDNGHDEPVAITNTRTLRHDIEEGKRPDLNLARQRFVAPPAATLRTDVQTNAIAAALSSNVRASLTDQARVIRDAKATTQGTIDEALKQMDAAYNVILRQREVLADLSRSEAAIDAAIVEANQPRWRQ